MALSDKDILITPNKGQSADPKIEFKGADASTGAQTITLNVYPTNGGTVSFEGSAGQLFSIANTMSGTIYSVNDVSGIPSIEVLDTGLVKLAQYNGNVLIGTGTDNGTDKLQINGTLTASVLKSTVASGTAPFTVTSDTLVENLNAEYLEGQLASYYTSAGNLTGTIPSAVLGNSTVFIGSTSVALNRSTGNLALTGITSIDGSAASVANSITFNDGGSGVASGTSYNGSVSRIISYNTVGAAASGHGHFVGTTAVQASSANQAVTGITSITGGTGNTAISFLSASTTSANSGAVTLSSGTTTTSGTTGNVTISTGNSAGVSGSITIQTGTPASGSNSGSITISSAAGVGTGESGSVTLRSGDNSSTSNATPGSVLIFAGGSLNTQVGGATYINGGANTSGTTSATGGSIYITGGSVTSTSSITKTTGSIYIDGGGSGANGTITYGAIYIGNFANGVSAGTSHVTIGKSGTEVRLPGVGTSGYVKLGPNGALSADNPALTITNDTSSNADTFYPAMVSNATTGSWTAAVVSSTKLYFNPSTGQLNATNFNSLSDERKKENIVQLQGALDSVLHLRGVKFNWKETGTAAVGVIAQEVEAVIPEVVSTSSSGEKSVNYGSLVGLLIEAIKEQNARIEKLESLIANK